MYTLEQLEQKSFRELRAIGHELNILPAGDKRCRQNWIDAIAGVHFPLLELLKLLEVSPGVEVDQVQEAIEVQCQEAIEIQPQESIAESSHESLECPRCYICEPEISPVTFSFKFLATYPPYFGEIHYKAEATGQLNLLKSVTDDEPSDPNDFESLDAFREAIALWDATHPELIEIGLDSFSEWALCPDDWYEPDTLLEPSEVLELSPAIECSITSEFSIPIFDALCDRTNGNNSSDEPPTVGVGARLPLPKPPSFPPMVIVVGDSVAERKNFSGFEFDCVAERKNFSGFEFDCVAEWKNFSGFMFGAVGARLPLPKTPSFPPMVAALGDRSSIEKFARSATLLSGRAPPGGDTVQS